MEKIKIDMIAHRDLEPFENIKKGIKKMEIRLFDEKRQKIQLGYNIKLLNREDENQFLIVKVIGLSRFKSFEDLYNVLDDRIQDYEKEVISRVYTKEKEEKYGVLVIHFELLDKNNS